MSWWAEALIAVGLVATPLVAMAMWSRAQFARSPGSFRCRLSAAPSRRHPEERWRRRRTRARWVNDVLLVQVGLLRTGVAARAASIPAGSSVRALFPEEAPGMGVRPVALRLMTDEGVLDVAVPDAHRLLLVGPFLAAALPGLPRAPRERGA